MNEQVNANDVISFLQQELTAKNLEVAVLKAKLAETLHAKDDKTEDKSDDTTDEPAKIDQEGEN